MSNSYIPYVPDYNYATIDLDPWVQSLKQNVNFPALGLTPDS